MDFHETWYEWSLRKSLEFITNVQDSSNHWLDGQCILCTVWKFSAQLIWHWRRIQSYLYTHHHTDCSRSGYPKISNDPAQPWLSLHTCLSGVRHNYDFSFSSYIRTPLEHTVLLCPAKYRRSPDLSWTWCRSRPNQSAQFCVFFSLLSIIHRRFKWKDKVVSQGLNPTPCRHTLLTSALGGGSLFSPEEGVPSTHRIGDLIGLRTCLGMMTKTKIPAFAGFNLDIPQAGHIADPFSRIKYWCLNTISF
jgi:hypothetical protein